MNSLRDYMKNNGLTQAEMARLLGVTQPTVWEWLNGKSFPSSRMLRAIAEKTGISADDLLKEVAA